MDQFPYITDYVNDIFRKEKRRWDYIFIRPPLLILYFVVRCVLFPIKFLFHRRAYGFEAYCIDAFLGFGLKYFATRDAAELIVRHIQIEPLLYRFLLTGHPLQENDAKPKKYNGVSGDFAFESIGSMIHSNLTIGHDELSYELAERFDKSIFFENLERMRSMQPDDHEALSKAVLKVNEAHSLQWFGATNVVMFIVFAITIFGDLHTCVKALNSFDSDSIVLWALKHLYRHTPEVLIDLDFYMQIYANRSHYNNSAFFSDPSQYLYYHVAFDEFAYHCLKTRAPLSQP